MKKIIIPINYVVLSIAVSLLANAGCEGVLESKNINNVLEDALDNPAAGAGVVSGALATVEQGVGYVLAPYEAATDEITWIGSRDAWNELNKGNLSNYYNEFVDQAWPYISEGRWMADKAVSLLSGFNAAGTLKNPLDLARAYLYAGIVRIYIADWFDDFVFSDKTIVGVPFGEANMVTLYDQAISNLNNAEPIARSLTTAEAKDLLVRVLAVRARAKYAKEVWMLIHPKPKTLPASNPFVGGTALADAQAALALMATEYKYQFDYFSSVTFNEFAWEAVGRSELAIEATPKDPITNADDPRWVAIKSDFTNTAKYQDRYSPLTVTSAREMSLIIAEAQLAAGNQAGATTTLNTLRALNSLPPITTQNVGDMLKHERRVNLFLQGRRLADMYRFGIVDPRWTTSPPSDAITKPGTFLPITIQERRANPNVK